MLDIIKDFIIDNCWYFSIILSSVLLFSSLCLFVRKILKHKINAIDRYSVLLFATVFFSGFFVLLGSVKADELAKLNFIESLYSSLKLFYADGTAKFEFNNAVLDKWHHIVYYILAFYAPLTLIYTVLSYFDNAINLLEIRFYALRHNVIIFSELNKKNLAIVKNFKSEQNKNVEKNEENVTNAFFDYKTFCNLEKQNKKVFIFCDVYKENTETSNELLEQAKELNCFVFKEDIVFIHKHIRKALLRKPDNKLIRYFLAGSDENENVRQTVEITEIEKENTTIKNLALFTFAENDANGYILEALNTNENFFVKRIKPSLMMAIDVLTKEENHLTKEDNDLKVLIVGLGNYGFELGKFLAWYYQRLTGNITIHFVDKNPNAISSLSGSFKDFLYYKPDLDNREQNACFECKIHQGIDIFSSDFTDFLKDIFYEKKADGNYGLDAVFCVLGDDNINTEAALHVRKLLDRINYKELFEINMEKMEDYKKVLPDIEAAEEKAKEAQEEAKNNNTDFNPQKYPIREIEFIDSASDSTFFSYENGIITDKIKIFSVVHDDKIKNNVNVPSGFIEECNIKFVGEDSSVYSYQNIFNAELEEISVKKRQNTIVTYNSNEYKRNSSLAEDYHNLYIDSIPAPKNESEEAFLERRRKISSKRWNAYMLAMGYTCFGIIQDKVAANVLFRLNEKNFPIRKWRRGKWHNSIVPFNERPKIEQENNYSKKS